MRYLLLLLLLGCLPALAQSSPAATGPNPLAATAAPATPDTAAAIHRLFAAKRHEGIGLGALAASSSITLGYGANSIYPKDDYSFVGKVAVTGLSAGAATMTLVWLLSFERGYSRRREQQAIAAWQAHRLSPHLKKKLTSRYFQPAR